MSPLTYDDKKKNRYINPQMHINKSITKKMTHTTVLLLSFTLFLALCHAETLIDYRLTLSKLTSAPAPNCTSAGPLCESCSSLAVCIHESDNTWTITSVQTCPSGQKCIKGACTSDPDPFCDGVADLEFPCKKVGIFPDPFYCNKFVMCVQEGTKLKPYLSSCEQGLGYNIATGVCDVKLDGGKCTLDEYPVPLCKAAGNSGALKSKPTEYYTCEEYSSTKKVLYPVIDVCPHAGRYNNYVCSN